MRYPLIITNAAQMHIKYKLILPLVFLRLGFLRLPPFIPNISGANKSYLNEFQFKQHVPLSEGIAVYVKPPSFATLNFFLEAQ